MPHRPVILASASPRRQELLKELVPRFEVVVRAVDEDALTTPDPFETATKLALAQAERVAAEVPDACVIGGDTVVAIRQDESWQHLTKPTDTEDAIRILSTLSGRTHLVITGVAVIAAGRSQVAFDQTEVEFRELSRAEIEAYVSTGEPMDKAGAYAIQGGAAGFVHRRTGSLSNVIGLPIETLSGLLKSFA